MVADLVGDYLFTDEDFVRNLSAEKPSLFKKIYDEIKYLCKMATTGSAEEKKLLEVKRAFEKAFKESGKNSRTDTIKYSLGKIVDGNNTSYGIGVHLDSTFLEDLSADERIELTKEYVKELGGQTFSAYDSNGNQVDVTIATSKRFKNKNGKRVPANKDLQTKFIQNETKQEAIALIDELVVTASFDGNSTPTYSHDWLDNNGQNDWEYWTTYIQDKNNDIWVATLNIANSSNGEKILYDIYPIKKVGQAVKSATAPTKMSVTQNSENASVKYSLEDSEGRKLTDGQKEYFKDSKVTDANGNLKVMYHGTPSDFTVFDPFLKGGVNGTAEGFGLYFADTPEVSEAYGGKLMTGYLNVTNPATSYEKTIKTNDLARLIKATAEAEANEWVSDGDYDNVEDALLDTWVSNYVFLNAF